MVLTADVVVTAGDSVPPVTATLKDATGAAIDLTGGVVTFRMTAAGATVPKVNATATVVGSPTAGRVSYAWQATDTDTPGYYLARWRVAYSGQVASVPNAGYLVVLVQAAV